MVLTFTYRGIMIEPAAGEKFDSLIGGDFKMILII